MKKHLASIYSLGVFFLGVTLSCSAYANFKAPPLQKAVTDQAGVLSPSAETKLNRWFEKLWNDKDIQFAILTVPSLLGTPLEQASIEIVDQWKLGSAKEDQGLLILIAKKERKIRIEVGQGLEGFIPDAYAKRVIQNIISPLFRQSRFDEAFTLASLQLMSYVLPDTDLETFLGEPVQSWKSQKGFSIHPLLFIALWLLMMWIISQRPRRKNIDGHFDNGQWTHFPPMGGGGGSFGGGGFSGGGGGFSGGGASGGW